MPSTLSNFNTALVQETYHISFPEGPSGTTVTRQAALRPEAVATMLAIPSDTAVTTPSDTVATAGFNIHQYIKTWEDEIESEESITSEEILDTLFEKFNINHPKNFHGHSLSVSDVIELDGIKYYCDDFGWVKIDE